MTDCRRPRRAHTHVASLRDGGLGGATRVLPMLRPYGTGASVVRHGCYPCCVPTGRGPRWCDTGATTHVASLWDGGFGGATRVLPMLRPYGTGASVVRHGCYPCCVPMGRGLRWCDTGATTHVASLRDGGFGGATRVLPMLRPYGTGACINLNKI